VVERDAPLAVDDTFAHERDSYRVTGIQPGHDEFDAVVTAEWIGEVGVGQFVP
jgi:hypothetical protein